MEVHTAAGPDMQVLCAAVVWVGRWHLTDARNGRHWRNLPLLYVWVLSCLQLVESARYERPITTVTQLTYYELRVVELSCVQQI
jgi:hypothetical protein